MKLQNTIKEIHNLKPLEQNELKTTDGGFVVLAALAAAAGIIYLAGEIAYIAGRQDSECDK